MCLYDGLTPLVRDLGLLHVRHVRHTSAHTDLILIYAVAICPATSCAFAEQASACMKHMTLAHGASVVASRMPTSVLSSGRTDCLPDCSSVMPGRVTIMSFCSLSRSLVS